MQIRGRGGGLARDGGLQRLRGHVRPGASLKRGGFADLIEQGGKRCLVGVEHDLPYVATFIMSEKHLGGFFNEKSIEA